MNNQAILDWLKEAEIDIMNFIKKATNEEIEEEISGYNAWTKHMVDVVNKDTWVIQFEKVFLDPSFNTRNIRNTRNTRNIRNTKGVIK